MSNNAPFIFYPSTLLWLDDDALFLQTLSAVFKAEQRVKTFHSSLECLNFFQTYRSALKTTPLLQGVAKDENYALNDHLPVDINLKELLALRSNPKRNDEASVMIVDHHMPNMTGIELCRELRHLPIKKILLTGEASHKEGVAAFNEGIIDRFLRKDDPDLLMDLQLHVRTLTMQYFSETTKCLLAHLEADYHLPQSDPAFINFFQEWCRVNRIREYYLIDKNGSLITFDDHDQARYFVIHTDRTLKAFLELNNDDDEALPYRQTVEQRQKIPFFGLFKEVWDFEVKQWPPFFHCPQVIEGRERYWWTVVGASR